MDTIGQIERATQNRVVQLFQNQLGYTYLGNWEDRRGDSNQGNSNIEEPILRKYLSGKKDCNGTLYNDTLINKALYELRKAANNLSDGLYNANKKVYELLRYGVKVKAEVGENFQTVELIDWKHPLKNEFALAEEVTIQGNREKRPDIVLYVNGIALGVLELKRSTISIGEGIRQSIVNQQEKFIQFFFTTIQWVFAGNDTQGLRYGTIGTSEKYFLKWKEEKEEGSKEKSEEKSNVKVNIQPPSPQPSPPRGEGVEMASPASHIEGSSLHLPFGDGLGEVGSERLHVKTTAESKVEPEASTEAPSEAEPALENLLDKYLLKLCEKKRFLEIIYDFILFDGGIKKLCRTHQYFGIKAAQEHIRRREGGIIWHTQGSGKSLVMVWLAKWILENNPHARVVIITDRDELDKQIERVFKEAGESMTRTLSGEDLMNQLGNPLPRMLCSLVHKFGRKGVDNVGNFDEFIEGLKNGPSTTVGELFVFVDECHRTQSNKLHKTMKAILKNAIFIGFTGTPLLKQDKQTSLEVFGKFIHTYKFNEAVEDKVILDLVYEARDIDQKISSSQKIDQWFEAKTRGLNDFQKMELKKKWGTMQKVLSCRSRLDKIVNDIVLDFNVKLRLNSGKGNAILVASSIYEACRYFELLQKTDLKGRCAIVTSYNPSTRDITTEDTGANTETEKEYIYDIYKALLGNKPTAQYEDEAKDKFIHEPANMKLLVVVDKLLTGFDAPPCSYLYIDKSMQDHGLFQAICRVNRLDSDDKEFGYIVDYKDLFKKVENAVAVYTSELDYDAFDKEDVDVLLKDRLEKGKERLNDTLEEFALLCEPVAPPKNSLAYIHSLQANSSFSAGLRQYCR